MYFHKYSKYKPSNTLICENYKKIKKRCHFSVFRPCFDPVPFSDCPPPHQTKKFIFHPTPQPLNTLAQSTQFGHSLEIMRKLQQLSTTPTDGSTSSVNILFTHLTRWNFRSGWKHGGFTFVVKREGKKASNTRKR